jgi:hypothetical protein
MPKDRGPECRRLLNKYDTLLSTPGKAPTSVPCNRCQGTFLLLLRSAQWRTLRRHVECGGPIDAQCHDAVPVEVPGAANQGLTRQEERDIKQRVMRPAVFLEGRAARGS